MREIFMLSAIAILAFLTLVTIVGFVVENPRTTPLEEVKNDPGRLQHEVRR